MTVHPSGGTLRSQQLKPDNISRHQDMDTPISPMVSSKSRTCAWLFFCQGCLGMPSVNWMACDYRDMRSVPKKCCPKLGVIWVSTLLESPICLLPVIFSYVVQMCPLSSFTHMYMSVHADIYAGHRGMLVEVCTLQTSSRRVGEQWRDRVAVCCPGVTPACKLLLMLVSLLQTTDSPQFLDEHFSALASRCVSKTGSLLSRKSDASLSIHDPGMETNSLYGKVSQAIGLESGMELCLTLNIHMVVRVVCCAMSRTFTWL